MDPLPYNLAAMPLYRSPGHWFGGGAAKIAADRNFGMLALLRLYTRPKGGTKNKIVCLSSPIEAAWQGEASGLLPPFCGANMAIW